MASAAWDAPAESGSSLGVAGADPSKSPEEGADAQPPTVHEFLAGIVHDPQAQAAFAADPAAALAGAGLGDLDAEELGYACSLALDYAPAEVVEAYRSSLLGGLVADGGLGRDSVTSSANHSTEIASMNMHKPQPGHEPHHAHHPDFGHHGDVDQVFMAKDSFNVVDIHDNGSNNSFGAPGHSGGAHADQGAHDPAGLGLPNPSEGAGAVTGALNQGAHQFHDAATHAPGVGPAASHVVPDHLPSPDQAPAAVTGALVHGPEQLHAAAASLPAVGPVASHLPAHLPTPDQAPAAVTGALSHGPEQLHDAAAGLPGAGPVASALPSHLPSPTDATSHLSSLAGHGPAGALGAPVENVADNVPGLGEAAGHLPLDGLHG